MTNYPVPQGQRLLRSIKIFTVLKYNLNTYALFKAKFYMLYIVE